jgi:UDP-N-acetylglucosamine 4-epimerase
MKILITGGAGFIGSNIADALLLKSAISELRIFDNLSTGSLSNIKHLLDNPKVTFIEGDILDRSTLNKAMLGVNAVCHQAALGSVPRSVENPLDTHEANSTGTFNVFDLARLNKVKRVVYASSSAIYGDHPGLPKIEEELGQVLSPYALTKKNNEAYATIFYNQYGLETIGLRYFNIFGMRQNPQGPYAAVIPLFIKAGLGNTAPIIHGDGLQSRDFTFVANAVHANVLALLGANEKAFGKAMNIACGGKFTLLELWNEIKKLTNCKQEVKYAATRAGDVKHSMANINLAKQWINYEPLVSFAEGLKQTIEYYKHD